MQPIFLLLIQHKSVPEANRYFYAGETTLLLYGGVRLAFHVRIARPGGAAGGKPALRVAKLEMNMNVWRKVAWLLAASLLSVSMLAEAQVTNAPVVAPDETAALHAAQQWAALVSQADAAGLEQLLHSDYRHIHATALVESRSQFVEALQSGVRKYELIRFEDSNVRVFGDSAVVMGRFNLKVLSRGKLIEGVNRFGMLVVKTPRGWQVASFQATPIPPPKS